MESVFVFLLPRGLVMRGAARPGEGCGAGAERFSGFQDGCPGTSTPAAGPLSSRFRLPLHPSQPSRGDLPGPGRPLASAELGSD